jgi:hypothetical protein
MVLAVAEDFRLFVFSVILACLFIVISGTGASVAIAVHTGVKRHRAIKAMEARASQT